MYNIELGKTGLIAYAVRGLYADQQPYKTGGGTVYQLCH